MPLRIFIGSSTEGQEKAEILQDLLYDQGDDIEPVAWWSPDAFPVGLTIRDSLRALMKNTDAALLLATEDDKTVRRGREVMTPGGNMLLEYGMALDAHGAERTALAVVGNPELPSDIEGVVHLRLEKGKDFKERNRGKIRDLVQQWRSTSRDDPKASRVPDAALQIASDTKDALALVDEVLKHRDDLLSNINLVERYQLNKIAIPMICRAMNVPGLKTSSLGHVVTLAAYTEFEKKSRWQWRAGYRHQTILTASDLTHPISGVSDEEREELKRGSGADPRRVSPASHQAVRGVSWYDAAVFCLFSGGRLPTKQELSQLFTSESKRETWEWSQSWFSEKMAHIAVVRRVESGEADFFGVNPDLRLAQIGFRIIR